MYADKDSRGLVSVFEMDRPDWTALQDAVRIAVGVWRLQLREYDGVPIGQDTNTEVIKRILHLKQSIASCLTVSSHIDVADEKRPRGVTYNPFDI